MSLKTTSGSDCHGTEGGSGLSKQLKMRFTRHSRFRRMAAPMFAAKQDEYPYLAWGDSVSFGFDRHSRSAAVVESKRWGIRSPVRR